MSIMISYFSPGEHYFQIRVLRKELCLIKLGLLEINMDIKLKLKDRLIGLIKKDGESLTGDSLRIFSTDMIVLLVGLLGGVLMARFWGPEGRGILTMIALIATTLFTISNLGLAEGSTYFISRYPEQTREYFYSIFFLAGILGIGFLGIAYLSFDYWYRAYQSYPAELFLLILPSSLFMLWGQTIRFSLLGLRKIKEFNLLNILQSLANLIPIVIVALLLNRSLKWYCVLYLVCIILVMLIGLNQILRITGLKGRIQRLYFIPVLSYGVRLYPAVLVPLIRGRLDYFLIGYFLAPADLGIYSIAVLLSENLLRIPAAMQMALFPRVSADRTDSKYALTARLLRVSNFVEFILVLVIIALGYPVIWILFGKSFLPAYIPLIILLFARIPEGMNKIISSFFAGNNQPGIPSVLGVTGITVSALIGWVLIPEMNLIGAGIAKLIASFVPLIPAMVIFYRQTKLGFIKIIIPDREDYLLIKNKIWSWIK